MKNKKIKNTKYESEDTKEVKNLIFIILGIVIIIAILYFLTARSLKRQDNNKVQFDYNVCTVGTMFNRPYEEYYVFLYSTDDNMSSQYQSLVNTYNKKEEHLKIFTVDLKSNLDNKYLSEESNTNPTNPSEVKIKDAALVYIKNGKVENYYETLNDFQKVLN